MNFQSGEPKSKHELESGTLVEANAYIYAYVYTIICPTTTRVASRSASSGAQPRPSITSVHVMRGTRRSVLFPPWARHRLTAELHAISILPVHLLEGQRRRGHNVLDIAAVSSQCLATIESASVFLRECDCRP